MEIREKFKNDLEYGKLGEEKIYSFFLGLLKDGKPVCKYVMDVRESKSFQAMDVDFILEFEKGNITMLEVKTDRQAAMTGNMIFETKSNNNIGCLARSQADAIAYYIPEKDEFYYMTLNSLKNFINGANLPEVPMGDNAKGYVIDIKELVRYGVAYRYVI